MDKFQLFCAFCFFAGFAWLCNSQVEENPLIVGGDFVDIKDHAHHLGMFNIQSSQPGSFFCGAVNINRLWAISAAHCVVNIAATAIRLYGGSSFRSTGGRFFNVERIISHPSFMRNTLDFDICAIGVHPATPLEGHENVAPIPLPLPCYSICCYGCPGGNNAVVAGWGRTNTSNNILAEQLKAVAKPLMFNDECGLSWRSPPITSRMICTRIVDGRDSCHGDSGGALTRDGILVGLVSFGSGICGDGSRPAVYVRMEEPQIRLFVQIYTGI